MYVVEYACMSHRGKIRRANQDNFVCMHKTLPLGSEKTARLLKGKVSPEKPVLFGIFDGMGGEEMGETASYTAADTAKHWRICHRTRSLDDLIKEASQRIAEFSRNHHLRTCGTTAAMLLFDSEGAVCANVGDSRVYRLSEGGFTQLSTDHVLPAYRKKKPPLLQYIGIDDGETEIEPSICETTALVGDTFLICSDGVTDMLSDEAIQRLMKNSSAPVICSALFDASMNAGGKDNITIIAARILDSKNTPSKLSSFFDRIYSVFRRIPNSHQ